MQISLLSQEETLQAGLVQVVEAELLYQRGRPPRARDIFKHALIQNAAYASLLGTGELLFWAGGVTDSACANRPRPFAVCAPWRYAVNGLR